MPVGIGKQHQQQDGCDGRRNADLDHVFYFKGVGSIGNHRLRRVDRQDEGDVYAQGRNEGHAPHR